MERTCPKCEQRLPEDADHFYWCPSLGNWSSACIECQKAAGRENYRRRRRDAAFVERGRLASADWAKDNRAYISFRSAQGRRDNRKGAAT